MTYLVFQSTLFKNASTFGYILPDLPYWLISVRHNQNRLRFKRYRRIASAYRDETKVYGAPEVIEGLESSLEDADLLQHTSLRPWWWCESKRVVWRKCRASWSEGA